MSMPTVFAACAGALESKRNTDKSLNNPRLGNIVSAMLYHAKPNKFKFIQSLNSVQLWRAGCSGKISARAEVARCIFDDHAECHTCTSASDDDCDYLPMMPEIDTDIVSSDNDIDSAADSVSSDDDMDSAADSVSSDDEIDTDSIPGMSEVLLYRAGYSLCWDNTQKIVRVRNESTSTKNKMLLWANAYATLNRVDRSCLNGNNLTLPACNIPLSAYLPSDEDLDILRERMEVITARILCQHIPHFQENYSDVATWHVEHEYSAEAKQKSVLVRVYK